MNILIDRDHRDQLHKVFHTDTNGNLLLPGDTIIGKESDFENRYKDEYSNKGPWVVENTEPSVIEIINNSYSIRHLNNNRAYQSNVPLNINGEKNWAIEAELKTIDQPITNQFGLVYGMNHTTGDKHLFYIDCNHQTMDIVSIDSGKVIWHLDRRRTSVCLNLDLCPFFLNTNIGYRVFSSSSSSSSFFFIMIYISIST